MIRKFTYKMFKKLITYIIRRAHSAHRELACLGVAKCNHRNRLIHFREKKFSLKTFWLKIYKIITSIK